MTLERNDNNFHSERPRTEGTITIAIDCSSECATYVYNSCGIATTENDLAVRGTAPSDLPAEVSDIPKVVDASGNVLLPGASLERKEDRAPRTALPPHPLDWAFEEPKDISAITYRLLKDPLFKQAVENALKAKQETETKYKENPNLCAARPAQAARLAFLKTLQDAEAVRAR